MKNQAMQFYKNSKLTLEKIIIKKTTSSLESKNLAVHDYF